MLGLRHFKKTAIDLFQGDLAEFVCDVMVVSANESLAEDEGVEGALRRRGGPGISIACQDIGQCLTGQAVLTTAGELPSQSLIHAVAPIWKGGLQGETSLLKSACRRSLEIATEKGLRHIAFSALGAVNSGFPIEVVASSTLQTIRAFLEENSAPTQMRRISMVLGERSHYLAFQKALFDTFPESDEDHS